MNHDHPIELSALPPNDSRYPDIRRVTLVGTAIDLLLTILKLTGGWLANSQALIADGIHSLSDLATNIVVLVAAKQGSKAADSDHPYGHERFETLATVILGTVLIAVGLGIAWEAVERLQSETGPSPGVMAIVIASLSVLSKEWLFHYTMRLANKIHSPMLKANAWHARSDAISSIVVIIGVAGTMLGYGVLDAIAAIIVALMIVKIGFELGKESINELVDRALEKGEVKKIIATVRAVPGVVKVHELRSRMMGGKALIDLHVQVGSHISVSEGHFIGLQVRQQVLEQFDEVSDVLVHIDPEDDDSIKVNYDESPQRPQIEHQLREELNDPQLWQLLHRFQFHYINGQLELECCFIEPLTEEQLQRLTKAALTLESVCHIEVVVLQHPLPAPTSTKTRVKAT
ncbi:cation transporter [Ectothiorhodospiraceae bacterium BW-2]|nr:cation transporter [Ectothiorhodospiraceae bacterium BW-2]